MSYYCRWQRNSVKCSINSGLQKHWTCWSGPWCLISVSGCSQCCSCLFIQTSGNISIITSPWVLQHMPSFTVLGCSYCTTRPLCVIGWFTQPTEVSFSVSCFSACLFTSACVVGGDSQPVITPCSFNADALSNLVFCLNNMEPFAFYTGVYVDTQDFQLTSLWPQLQDERRHSDCGLTPM